MGGLCGPSVLIGADRLCEAMSEPRGGCAAREGRRLDVDRFAPSKDWGLEGGRQGRRRDGPYPDASGFQGDVRHEATELRRHMSPGRWCDRISVLELGSFEKVVIGIVFRGELHRCVSLVMGQLAPRFNEPMCDDLRD